jgi:thermostable 8-oxoguanine DNA glycosylase
MENTIAITDELIQKMDNQLRTELFKKDSDFEKRKLWENTYIKHQIDKRKAGKPFTVSDHIHGMVYSMISSGTKWETVVRDMDEVTGQILPVDKILHNYSPEWLLNCSPEQLSKELSNLHYGCRFIKRQVEALIQTNIPNLLRLEQQYGTVDNYYAEIIRRDSTLKLLVTTLADSKSENKMAQLDKALVSEYLRNVGYDIPKPDRHIRRILGRIVGLENEIMSEYETFDIICELAKSSGSEQAEIDYILWSYCADGFGEICTANNPKCDKCVLSSICVLKFRRDKQ